MFFFFEKGDTGANVAIDYINPALPEFADGQRWLRMEGNPANLKAKRKEWLPRGKTCTVLLQVRDKEVIVFLDDEEVFRTPADWSRLGQGGGIGKMRFGDLTGETIFGVGVYDCHATFHSIEMRRVSETNASASASTPATKDTPFINSLGMKFVPVPITGGPTDGKRLLFSVWETRVQDYEMFVKETKRTWMKPPFDQDLTHPAVNVNWLDAVAFCAWLTGRERTAGRLGTQEVYRLPSDHEWSCAAGMGGREDAASPPQQKTHNLADVFLWGSEWPPPPGAGNFHGEEMDGVLFFKTQGILKGYWDGFARTAPTGSFPPNSLGLFDLSGNVSEYCEDWYDATQKSRVTRGASWGKNLRNELSLAFRDKHPPSFQNIILGFRCVIAPSGSTAAVSPPPSQQVSSSSVATATKEAPFVNSLGMRFVPVPITGGPADGKRVLFSVWETRVQDYEVFVKERKHEWPKTPFEQGPAHPAVNISWQDAGIFCTWLTNKERAAGTIGPQDKYRLPSDHEWSCAAGIGGLEDGSKSPSYKNRGAHALADEPATANFSGAETADKKMFANQMAMENHRDDHPYTAPVASFLSNPLGLYDMAGNVAEWCDDLYYQTDEPGDKQRRTFRGSTFVTAARVKIGARSSDTPNNRAPMRGMRVALEVSTGAPHN
jgi:formylglycine-generating enzyme required for sulfatase activity